MQHKPKKKKCRSCGIYFLPYSSLDKTCSLLCSKKLRKIELQKKREKKKYMDERKKDLAVKRAYLEAKRLTKVADLMFSLYIRERDRGLACISCNKRYSPNFQCGHFVSRGAHSTRWNRKNAHGQCPACNAKHIGGGMVWQHGKAIDKKYGPGTADTLMQIPENSPKVEKTQKLHYIRRDYEGLLEMGVKPKDLVEYFKKAMNRKSFNILKYFDGSF